MSDQQQVRGDPPAELTEAIEENPEAFATFVRNLDTVNELLEVADLGTSAVDDEMVSELSRTVSTLAESADGVATDETVQLAEAVGENGETLADALAALARLQRSGALDDVVELAEVASLARGALDDEMVRSVAGTGSTVAELVDTAAEDGPSGGIQTLLGALGDAEAAGPLGLREIWRALRDGEFVAGVGYLLAVLRALGRAVTEQ